MHQVGIHCPPTHTNIISHRANSIHPSRRPIHLLTRAVYLPASLKLLFKIPILITTSSVNQNESSPRTTPTFLPFWESFPHDITQGVLSLSKASQSVKRFREHLGREAEKA
ncbi:unnamed protein product, partial [Vitis vinifera]